MRPTPMKGVKWDGCESIKIYRCMGKVFAMVLAVYIGSYLTLTLFGRPEVATSGLSGPKTYGWAPYGFFDSSAHHWTKLMFPYFPLYVIDIRVWHKDIPAGTKRY